MQAIGDGQRTGLDICGRSGLGDGEVLGFLLDDVVAACNVLDGHPAGTGVGVVGILYRVFVCRNDLISVLEGHGRLQRIAGVGAGCDFNRGCHFSWRNLPLDRGLTGVVAGTLDSQGEAVIDIGGRVAAYNTVGNIFSPFFQCHTGNLRRLLRRVVFEVGRFQRNHCALDGLGSDLDSCGVGYGCVFLGIRSERPFDTMTKRTRVQNRIVRLLPRESALDLCAGIGVFHLARNFALAQCVTVGNRRCGDLAVQHGNDLVLRDDFNGQEHVLIVVRGDLDAYGSDGTFGLRFDSRDSQLELIV